MDAAERDFAIDLGAVTSTCWTFSGVLERQALAGAASDALTGLGSTWAGPRSLAGSPWNLAFYAQPQAVRANAARQACFPDLG